MQNENITEKNYCNQCKCAYFGEYCPICKKGTDGKTEPKEFNTTNAKKKKSSLGLKLFPLFIIIIVLAMAYSGLNGDTKQALNSKINNLLFNKPQVDFPANGIGIYNTDDEKTNIIEIKSDLDKKLYIKFKDASTKETVFTAYISQNSETALQVPAGKYIIQYVTGDTWYGTEYYFGPDTEYYESNNILDCGVEDDTIRNRKVNFYSSISSLNVNHSNKGEFDK